MCKREREGHGKMEVEIGVMHLRAKEGQDLLAATRSQSDKQRTFLGVSGGSMALLTPSYWTSGPRTVK